MNENFNIQYYIGNKKKNEISRVKTISQFEKENNHDGYILINIGDYEYGFFPLDDSSSGFELLDIWFKILKEVYIKIKSNPKVFMDYWEEQNEFFIFEREDGNIRIQYLHKVLPVVNNQIQNSFVYEVKLVAETVVLENYFFDTVKTKVNEFWDELSDLNPSLKNYFEKFKINS